MLMFSGSVVCVHSVTYIHLAALLVRHVSVNTTTIMR
jgi:hypothetical protein